MITPAGRFVALAGFVTFTTVPYIIYPLEFEGVLVFTDLGRVEEAT